MSVLLAMLLGGLFALGLTVFVCIAIMPTKKRPGLSPFMQKIHDIVNFRQLLVEQILKVLYVFNTFLCICGGFFLLFGKMPVLGYGFEVGSASTALIGIIMIVLGPILCRILYETTMVFILLLKNTMEINKRLGGSAHGDFASEIEIDKLPAIKKPQAPANEEQKPE